MNCDIETIGDDFAIYQPETDIITIYLANIYHEALKKYWLNETLFLNFIIDTIHHEEIHKAIDTCLEGNPNEIDDHKIFKYLRDF
jgi:tetrahydromethanopterin S-methyltransferase subunit A